MINSYQENSIDREDGHKDNHAAGTVPSADLLGAKVWHNSLHTGGVITSIEGRYITVSFHGSEKKFKYPDAFASVLELENEELQDSVNEASSNNEFNSLKKQFVQALDTEVKFLKQSGGKGYRLYDGTLLTRTKYKYIYTFDADSELHFPDDTQIRINVPNGYLNGVIISCDGYSVIIQTYEKLPEDLKTIEFSAEPWQLLVTLSEKVRELQPSSDSLAYAVACKGKYSISRSRGLALGQQRAIEHALDKPVTFIWGPPGTGKTEVLASIARQFIDEGKRVLMLSYSNVSVDGALLRVAKKVDHPRGRVVRYGYARLPEVLESPFLSSYQYVLSKHPGTAERYRQLLEQKKKCKRNDPSIADLNAKIAAIRKQFVNEEIGLIQSAAFVATTVSKGCVLFKYAG